MSRSVSIRRKIAAAFLLPVVALSLGAGAGMVDAHRTLEQDRLAGVDAATAEDLFAAALAIGDERLSYWLADLSGESPDDSERIAEAVLATDDAMEILADSFDETVTERVWTSLATARSTPVGRTDNYSRAARLVLDRSLNETNPSDSAAVQSALDGLGVIHDYVEAEDVAWLAFVERNAEDLRSGSVVLRRFAASDEHRLRLARVDTTDASSPVQTALASTAVMTELRSTAVEDVLNDDQTLVTNSNAILSHSDARFRWRTAASQQASNLRSLISAEVDTAEDRRNQFGLFGLFGVLVFGSVAIALYQSVTSPMSAATAQADLLVNHRLPELERAFQRDDATVARPAEIGTTDDEVGELVATINTVQNAMFDIAERESDSRRTMAARTVTLANRNVALLHELVRSVAAWRNADASPEVRQRLFAIDHIATRMQRNIEAALVVAGGHSERRWTKPISAVNTTRLALGEINEFDRVDVAAMADTRLHGLVAPEIAHLLAELIDNALRAGESAANPRVSVEGEWVGAGWAFLIHDSGVGLDRAELDRINVALHTPSLAAGGSVQPAAGSPHSPDSAQSLGFVLVARTAMRFGIDVRLLERATGGTTAKVVLPVDLLDSETVPEDRKRIDAGRAGDIQMVIEPVNEAHNDAVEAFFRTETSSARRKRLPGRRGRSSAQADNTPANPATEDVTEQTAAAVAVAPANSNLWKLIGSQP